MISFRTDLFCLYKIGISKNSFEFWILNGNSYVDENYIFFNGNP